MSQQKTSIILYEHKEPSLPTGSKPKQKNLRDILDMTNIFTQPQENIVKVTQDEGILMIKNSIFSLPPKPIDEAKLNQEEGGPSETSTIYFNIEIRNLAGELMNKDTSKNHQKIKIGQTENKSTALHLGLLQMKYGEKAVFRVKPEYQQILSQVKLMNKLQNVQEEAKVVQFQKDSNNQKLEEQIYIIQYLDYENVKKQPMDYTYEERISKSESINKLAKEFFQQQKYQDAEKQFAKIQTYVFGVPKIQKETLSKEQLDKLNEEHTRSFVNMGICRMKVNDWRKGKEHLENALKIQPSNFKASYMIGRCCFNLGNFIEAKVKLNTCLENKQITEEIRQEIIDLMIRMNNKVDKALMKKEKQMAEVFSQIQQQNQHIIKNLGTTDQEEIQKERQKKLEKNREIKKQQQFIDMTSQGGVFEQKDLLNMNL